MIFVTIDGSGTIRNKRSIMPGFVAYYRVSTDRQGESGLGLEAQREAVARYAGAVPLLAEFEEIESGKSHANRPKLAEALAMCRKRKATLVIAKLDRLARNVHFVSGLMESRVQFVAVDMPMATPLTVHIIAAFAEHEREQISQRTRAAMQAAKARGMTFGNPRWQESLDRARAMRDFGPLPVEVVQQIKEHRAQGWTLRQIAQHLEKLGIPAQKGNRWYPKTVRDKLIQGQQQ